jgi:hypothetical protein
MATSYLPSRLLYSPAARKIKLSSNRCAGILFLTSTAMHLIAIQRGLWAAGLFAEVLLLGTLLRRGLVRRYPFLFLYFAADLIWGLVLIQIDYRSLAYALGYRLYLITIWVVS